MPASDPATFSVRDGWSPEPPPQLQPGLSLGLLSLGVGARSEGAHFCNSVITIIALTTTQAGARWGLWPRRSAPTSVHFSSSTWGHRRTAQGTAPGHPPPPAPPRRGSGHFRQTNHGSRLFSRSPPA